MPNKTFKPCNYPGCHELTRERFCEKHKQQDRKWIDERRGNANERGYSYRWQKYRENYLKEHSLCDKCLEDGKITISKVVDHIIPHKGDMVLFWQTDNHQALCKRCHDIKTVKEDGGFGNERY